MDQKREPRTGREDPDASRHGGGRASPLASEPRPVPPHEDVLSGVRDPPPGPVLTTDQGVAIPHTDDSLKAGIRGPTLLQDFHLREKIMRFDHERIPERVVHARGAGAHGHFRVYESLEKWTCADFLGDPSLRTPVFVRFSTVVGSRGSADTVRDARGFATKFYTRRGNFDLVGNNLPVFFIQDGAKFPDLVHAIKPEPHHEMPQAASAHDTFWDFVSLVPETLHMVLWVMSDRGIPRSFRMMDGFGVNTYRLLDARGRSSFVKFHWRPLLGAHSLVWEEAQRIAGVDPDFHRRDLWEAIEDGDPVEYELGLQIVPEKDALALGFDLLDPTKLIPEEVVPLRRVGKMTLDRNPTNFFAEVEQAAFCVANLVPGIDLSDDPLLQARAFSYMDTQLTRLGGPNFAEIPINRPLVPAQNHQQDGFHRSRVPTARALYHPNSIAGDRPALASPEEGFRHFAEPLAGEVVRQRSESFREFHSQPRLFLESQSPAEREHLIDACRFELGKVERLGIRERVVRQFLEIDESFARAVAAGIGVTLGDGEARRPRRNGREADGDARRSPALSLTASPKDSIKTRRIAALVAEGVRIDDLDRVARALVGAGARIDVVSHDLGPLRSQEGRPVDVTKTFQTTDSVLYDALYVPGGPASVGALASSERPLAFLRDAFRHGKAIGATSEGVELLARARLPGIELDAPAKSVRSQHGVVWTRGEFDDFDSRFVDAIRAHRHFDRAVRVAPEVARKGEGGGAGRVASARPR